MCSAAPAAAPSPSALPGTTACAISAGNGVAGTRFCSDAVCAAGKVAGSAVSARHQQRSAAVGSAAGRSRDAACKMIAGSGITSQRTCALAQAGSLATSMQRACRRSVVKHPTVHRPPRCANPPAACLCSHEGAINAASVRGGRGTVLTTSRRDKRRRDGLATFPPSRAHKGRIGACGGMYRLRLLQTPASAACACLAREACCFSHHGAATARSGASCAVRHVSCGAVDTTSSGAAPAHTAAGPPQDKQAALLHAELSRHGDVRVEVVQQARACVDSVEACVADAVAPQVLQQEPDLAASEAARQTAASRFALLAKVSCCPATALHAPLLTRTCRCAGCAGILAALHASCVGHAFNWGASPV